MDLFTFSTFAIGFVLVFVFSLKDFNAPEYPYGSDDEDLIDSAPYARLAKPALPRYMVDPSSYTLFMFLFAVIAGIIYMWFTKILLSLPLDLAYGEKGETAVSALVSAFLIVGIVRADDIKVEKLQFLLKWPKTLLFGMVKHWLHSFVFIPDQSKDIFHTLCFTEIKSDSNLVKTHLEKLFEQNYRTDIEIDRYLERSDFTNPGNSGTMTARWARLSYFIFIVDQWSRDPRFKSHVSERSLGWLPLKKAYIALIEKMAEFRNMDAAMSQDEETELSQQVDHLLANCYRLISCVVVMASSASEHPMRLIHDIGLKVNPGALDFYRRQQVFRVVFIMVPTIALMAVWYAMLDPNTTVGGTIKKIFIYIESALYIMVLPIILVTMTKQYMAKNRTWRIVSRDNPYKSFFDRPLELYLILSGISFVIALFLMMLRINEHGLMAPRASWYAMAMFCGITAGTAFFICIRCDSSARVFKNRIRYWGYTLKYTLTHAALTALLVWTGLKVSQPPAVDHHLWQYPLMGFVLSVTIGFTLFCGKHKVEKRHEANRTDCDEEVTIIQEGLEMPAILINKSSNGGMLRLNQARFMLDKDDRIEIVFKDGVKKVGAIVDLNMDNLNVAYQA